MIQGNQNGIYFERIRLILSGLSDDEIEKCERPNYDPFLMLKILIFKQWYILSDSQIETQIRDRFIPHELPGIY